jgi:hypothetical protein
MLCALGGLGAEARADDDGPPIRDDLERARALGPPPGTLGPAPEEPKPGEQAPEETRPFVRIAGYARMTSLPEFVFGLAFEESTDLSSVAAGGSVEFGDLEGSLWAIGVDWTALTPRAGNWNQFFSDPADATYVEANLHMLSVDVTYRNNLPFARWMRAVFGGGLGVGYLLGDIRTADILPTCVEPVATCAHWPTASNSTADLPTRIVPVLHFSGGLEFDLGEQMSLRVETGFRDVFYAGLALGLYL